MKVTYVDHMGTDLSVVNAARVSFDKRSDSLSPRDERLIRYLAKHQHYSPFNHTFCTCHVEAPILVARQLVKHKFMPWNEMSGRYVTFKPTFYVPEVFRSKSDDKKQGSGPALEVQTSDKLTMLFEEQHASSFKSYLMALELGLCEEQARGLLPTNLYTQWYWSGTLGAWASMYNLRIKEDAQKETQEIAKQIGSLIGKLYPVSWSALTEGDDNEKTVV